MAESGGIREKAKGLTGRAKAAVGQGDPPLATQVDGRIPAIREALKAFGEGDHDRFLSAFDEEVEWYGPSGSSFPGAGDFTGRDEIQNRFVAAVGRTYASFGFHPGRYLENESEDIVIVLGRFVGEGRDQGSSLDVHAAMVWEWDKNRVTRITVYADSDAFPKVIDEEEDQKREKEEQEEDSSGQDSNAKESGGEDREREPSASSGESSASSGDSSGGGDETRGAGSDGGGDQSSVDERRDERGHEAERAREQGT